MKVYVSACVVILIFCIATIRVKVPKELQDEKMRLIQKRAYPFYIGFCKLRIFLKRKKPDSKLLQHELCEKRKLKALNPTYNPSIEHEKRILKMICHSLLVVFIGLILASITEYQELKTTEVIGGYRIKRNQPMENEKVISLKVSDETGMQNEIIINVGSQTYTDKQLNDMKDSFCQDLKGLIVGNNESLNHITTDLNLVNYVEGYPFEIDWEFSDVCVFTHSGKLQKEEIDSEGTDVDILAKYYYEDFLGECLICVHVEKEQLPEEEIFSEKVKNGIQARDNKQKEYLELPKEIEGIKIRYEEIKEHNARKFLVIIAICPILLIVFQKKELTDEVKNRKEELLLDYSEIVSKLTILVGAGMSVRAAFKRMVQEYQKELEKGGKKRYAYEELWITVREMETGISESEAYDHFGKRCEIREYVKLSALITQNMKKGSKAFASGMQEEALEAFEKRKNLARATGEKAGTKILLPMIMNLGFVMLLIMIPIFTSL